MPIQVLLADDHQIMRQGLKGLLEREGFKVVAEAEDGREAVRQASSSHPDVVVLDLAMPALNGVDAAREIVRSAPRTKAILLTMHKEDAYILQALSAGVSGYVLKTDASAALVQAIRAVTRGSLYLSPCVSWQYCEPAGSHTTSRPLHDSRRASIPRSWSSTWRCPP